MALGVLFCVDLMVNVENSPVRTFTLFPKHVTSTPRYGQLVLGNTLNVPFYIKDYSLNVLPNFLYISVPVI